VTKSSQTSIQNFNFNLEIFSTFFYYFAARKNQPNYIQNSAEFEFIFLTSPSKFIVLSFSESKLFLY